MDVEVDIVDIDFFFEAEDGIRDDLVTGVQTCCSSDLFIGASPSADGVGLEQVKDGEIRGWWCRPRSPKSGCGILFLHGGAYIQGSPKASRGIASQIAARVQGATLVISYPLAPQHPLPAAPQTALSAYRWLEKQGFENVAIVGESGGGGLALVTLARIAADKDPLEGS